jgi:L-amino acid N-acyltransferase
MQIRDATADDVGAITDLFNALLATTTVTWRDEPTTAAEQRDWFEEREWAGCPTLIAEDEGRVVGYCSWTSFRGGARFPGYRHTVEHSIHVDEGHRGQGVGKLLLVALMGRARGAGIHAMVAGIDADNGSSLAFHEALGFVEVGRMPQVGRKFERWLDLVLVQRILDR